MKWMHYIGNENLAFLNILMKQKEQLMSILMNNGPCLKYKGTFLYTFNIVSIVHN